MFNQVNSANVPEILFPLSMDGYVRITLETLKSLPLSHLLSGIDLDSRDNCHAGASLTDVSGYTEWVTATLPAITLGWDWRLDTSQGCPIFKRIEAPRSNIMIVDDLQQDVCWMKTAELLSEMIDHFDWQQDVCKSIAITYT
ncbi:MAG: DUF4902 domain-containing protein [Sulfuriferula sp.]|nr:DUF4902 domain-containing protein [Sulfuriferula sp.]